MTIGYHPARVLIVDDERHNRQLLEVMLAPEGLLIQTAASGEEALAIVARHPPDLILLDIMMPGMDGHELAACFKANVATKNIPIIMVTALSGRDDRLRGLRAGAEEFLTKPVDRVELCVRVRNLLRLKAYGEYFDKYSRMLESKVALATADLVERTRQAALLAEQAALLDLAKDAIVVRDMNSNIVFWSRGAAVLYGWSSDEAIGRNTDELLQTQPAENGGDIQARLLRDGEWEGETIHHKRGGARVIVASRVALQRDADGTPVRILTVDNDITDRRQGEDALEQFRQDQLRFKDEFLSHVSHELRSPLTAIKQFTTILLGGLAGDLNDEQRQYQEIVLKNIRQLQSMIDDLLEVTRLETGKLTIEPESVSIVDVLTDTFNTFQGTALAKRVTLSCDMSSELPSAYADQTRVRQVLNVLLDNAIKFTPDGGRVTLEARLLEQDARFLLLQVSDTGCGIDTEIRERIFERLYQVPAAIESSRNGLGLGLYICKELVTRQGGQIWVERQQTQGSTFSFTLPVFSLSNVLAPLLKDDKWPAESVALVIVETCMPNGWPSSDSREEWSNEAGSFLQRCLLPDLDVLLPNMRLRTREERFFVAAFANETGAAVLAKRIRGQLDRLPAVKNSALTVSVSYKMLPPFPSDVGMTTEDIVTRMATGLEASINSLITTAGVQ
jgi:PAS domain S-box-containing protein